MHSLLLASLLLSAHGARCGLRDDDCWGAYARVSANELRRAAGVRALTAAPAEAALSAREHAVALATGALSRPLPTGCGWAAVSENVARVSANADIVDACMHIWSADPAASDGLLDPTAGAATFGSAEAGDGAVCVLLMTRNESMDDGKCAADEEEGGGGRSTVTREDGADGRRCYRICVNL